jgi:hypothetical protein
MIEAVARLAVMALAQTGITRAIAPSATRLTAAGLCGLAAAILATACLGCASAALWVWGIPRLGSAGAPLMVASVLLIACFAVLAWMRHILRTRPVPSVVNPAPAVLLTEAKRLFADQKGGVLMAALIAGLAAGQDEE